MSAEEGDDPPPAPSAVGEQYAGVRDIILLAALLVLMALTLGVALVQAWPPAAQPGAVHKAEQAVRVRVLFWSPHLLRETRLFIVVAAVGGLGAVIHTLRSLYWYVGNRGLRRSWVLMYVLEPFAGSGLALIVYFVLRGGLTTTMASSSDINPYGVTALGALVGMFSRETAGKLRAVFAMLLAPAEKGADSMAPDDTSPQGRRPGGTPGPR
ncbi:hypothetical protein ACFQVC_06885 [Streptomyces monticola]|uniref:ABC transporter permease n=1 Tax=Streptomyces monticola TaxID=2666263 RepID=A0ABW2JEA9_9ACTN